LAGFSGLFLLLSKDYGTTAALFPRVIASVSLAFIILDVLWEYFSASGERAKPKEQAQGSNAGWLAPFALQGGYIALIYVAGFATATFLYLLACPWQLRYRNWIVTTLHAVLLTFVIVYTFHFVFHVRLPKGLLGIPW
jgi:sterol desaturase/sphingolipid hydroxylase (fatty acid hydroxylase superfamily)